METIIVLITLLASLLLILKVSKNNALYVAKTKCNELIDEAEAHGETSVYLNDLKKADTLIQIQTAINNYLNWKDRR